MNRQEYLGSTERPGNPVVRCPDDLELICSLSGRHSGFSGFRAVETVSAESGGRPGFPPRLPAAYLLAVISIGPQQLVHLAIRAQPSGALACGGRVRQAGVAAPDDHVAGGIEPGTPVRAVLDNVSSPQVGRSRSVAEGPSGLDVPFRPELGHLDECRRGVFSKLSRQRLRHSVFNSRDECIAAIEGCIERRKRQRRPPVPLEQEARRSRGGMEKGAPEAEGMAP